MKTIRDWLWAPKSTIHEKATVAVRIDGYKGHPAGSDAEWWAMLEDGKIQPPNPGANEAPGYEDPENVLPLSALRVPMPKVAAPRSIVGGLVAKLTRSLKTSLESRGELEERIAADTETLRQVNASIAAIETALLSVSDDPALTAEERKAAVEFVDVQLAADVMADLGVTDGEA